MKGAGEGIRSIKSLILMPQPNTYLSQWQVMDEAAVMLKGNITTKPEFIGVRNKNPIPKSRVAGIDIVTMYGGVWYVQI